MQSGFYLFIPIGVIELILGIWLLIFGFREKTAKKDLESIKVDNNLSNVHSN